MTDRDRTPNNDTARTDMNPRSTSHPSSRPKLAQLARATTALVATLGMAAGLQAQAQAQPAAPQDEVFGRYEDLMTLPPELQAPTYRHMDRLYPTRTIQRGTHVHPLPEGKKIDVSYQVGDQRYGIDEFMARNRTAGLLVIKDGKVVLERYAMGNDAKTKWLSFSVAKSLSSTLVGAAVKDGFIASLDDSVVKYVPALRGSAYDEVTVKQVLQMSSGVAWNEDYLDPASDRRQMLRAQLAQEKGAVLKFMAQLPRVAPAGTRFNYSTGETYLVGEILAGAIKQPISAYLSKKIWAPFGMEADAYWQLDSPNGQEFTGSGVNATLRDFGRFGLFVLEGGVAGGKQVLPANWIADATRADPAQRLAPGTLKGFEPMGYGYQWWTFPVGEKALPNLDGGLFAALGIFGQQIYINPKEKLVVAIHSTWPKPIHGPSLVETDALLGALTAALRK
jgi:CubicO group peptidase (beta-lactamase class C family)